MERHDVPAYGRSAVRSPVESNFPGSPMTSSFPGSPMSNNFPRSPMSASFPNSPMTNSFPRPQRPPPSRDHSSTRPPPSPRPPPSRDHSSTRPPPSPRPPPSRDHSSTRPPPSPRPPPSRDHSSTRPHSRDPSARPPIRDGDRISSRDADRISSRDADRISQRDPDRPSRRDTERPFRRDVDHIPPRDPQRPIRRDIEQPFRRDADPRRDPDHISRRDPGHPSRRDPDQGPRRDMPAYGRLGSKSSMHSLRNNPARPAPRPPLSPQEAEELAKRLKGSYIANEEDAKRAEAEAKRNYDNLEDEMVMARKFKNDNASEKRKIEVQMADIREKLQGLRADWEAARAENEALRRKEPEMLEVKKLIDNGRLILTLAEMERKKDVWREYNSAMSAAKESYTKVNDMKCKLIEEDKAVKDKDGRRLKRFNEGIEGHDKRRFVMKSRLARACHYTIYHAKRSHTFLLELSRLNLPPALPLPPLPPSPISPTIPTRPVTPNTPNTPNSGSFPNTLAAHPHGPQMASPLSTPTSATFSFSATAMHPNNPHKPALLALEAQIVRAEGYLKGPIDSQTGERFWTMQAHRSWWVKIPDAPLGFPPSP